MATWNIEDATKVRLEAFRAKLASKLGRIPNQNETACYLLDNCKETTK